MEIASTHEEYIAGFSEEIQHRLKEIRAIITSAAPGAHEVISYAMPGFRMNSMIVWYAGHDKHIGFYPTAAPIVAFSEELKGYKTSKGAIQFPIGKPIPKTLVKKIVRYQVARDLEKAAAKSNTKKIAAKSAKRIN